MGYEKQVTNARKLRMQIWLVIGISDRRQCVYHGRISEKSAKSPKQTMTKMDGTFDRSECIFGRSYCDRCVVSSLLCAAFGAGCNETHSWGDQFCWRIAPFGAQHLVLGHEHSAIQFRRQITRWQGWSAQLIRCSGNSITLAWASHDEYVEQFVIDRFISLCCFGIGALFSCRCLVWPRHSAKQKRNQIMRSGFRLCKSHKHANKGTTQSEIVA